MTRGTARTGSKTLRLVDVQAAPNSGGSSDGRPGAPIAETFEAFYRREFPRLVTLATALSGHALAADIAQESMLVAYRRWDVVSVYESPAGWVRGVCSHKASSVVRRKAIESRALARLRLHRPYEASASIDGDDAFWSEVRLLPRRQAQAAALFYALDLSIADIAATLECAEGTVKAHLSRARAALASRLGVGAEEEA
jgi:RNA polymerase sigma-70 factor (ECF subfamily)